MAAALRTTITRLAASRDHERRFVATSPTGACAAARTWPTWWWRNSFVSVWLDERALGAVTRVATLSR